MAELLLMNRLFARINTTSVLFCHSSARVDMAMIARCGVNIMHDVITCYSLVSSACTKRCNNGHNDDRKTELKEIIRRFCKYLSNH